MATATSRNRALDRDESHSTVDYDESHLSKQQLVTMIVAAFEAAL